MRQPSIKYLRIALVVLAVVLAGCSGGGGTPTEDGTAAAGDNPAQMSGEWSPTKNDEVIENSGSYTLTIQSEGVVARGNSITRTPVVNLTVKHDIETGEYLYSFGSTGRTYHPPDSDTVYTKYGEEVRESTSSEVGSFTYTNLTSNQAGTANLSQVLGQLDASSGSTALGPADKYVITDESSVDLPGNVSSEYGTVESYKRTIWLDKDTGVLTKFTTERTVVDGAGDEHTLTQSFVVSDLGSTTIDEPSWVPGN